MSIDLNNSPGNPPTVIGQTILTAIGTKYRVSLSLNINPYCGTTPKTGFVSAGDATKSFTTSDTTTQRVELDFVASSSSTLIQIGSTTQSTACGPAVFDISVVQVCVA